MGEGFEGEAFKGNGHATLIGSIPLADHIEASQLVFDYAPDIPVWAQLPVYAEEGMVRQYTPGMPGLAIDGTKPYIDTESPSFSEELLGFFEEYMAVSEGETKIEDSRFALKPDVAKGFFIYQEKLRSLSAKPVALKGQVTGPITFATALKDQHSRAIFYDAQLRDAAVKLLSLKARWQIQALSEFNLPVIIFIDEPALAGFGSSEFIGISLEEVAGALGEVIDAIHADGGLAGIHVCANTDWSLILDSDADIVNFDAYAYFDRFILYNESLKRFLDKGGNIAWGIVPTLEPANIEKETVDSLADNWNAKAEETAKKLGMDRAGVIAQSIITPSCGTGSLSAEHATRVLQLAKELSERIRKS